ncbi:MAG: hypothetical protein EBU46_15020 [Nitrosomonadaceae bacterium]|nr:hypothetical protein [Nitrosomonadaceae bacterium]
MNAIPVRNLELLVARWRAKAEAVRALNPIAELLGAQQAVMMTHTAEAYEQAADELEDTYKPT